MTAESIKISLIQRILATRDLVKLKQVQHILSPASKADKILESISKPIQEKLDIEELNRKQDLQPFDKADFLQKIEALEIEESLDELISMV